MIALLHSSLRRFGSRSVVFLRYTGKRNAKICTTPMRYREEGYALPAMGRKR